MMKIADNIEMLEVAIEIVGRPGKIYPSLIRDEHTAILVDTGLPGQWHKVREAIEQAGVSLNTIDKVIFTHQDKDHTGGAPELFKEIDRKVEIVAHELDRPVIEGKQELLKANMIRGMLQNLPDEQRAKAEALFFTPQPISVDRVVEDNAYLPDCGGITFIHTPGHTPGHFSIYLHQSKTLLAADAMIVKEGRLSLPEPHTTPDMETAIQSLKKLAAFEIEHVVCYHGGYYAGNANKAIEELANR